MTDLSVHPDARRLKQEIADLRTQLAETLEHTLRLEEIEGPELRARYHDQLGPFQLEILELRFENAAVERKIERLIRLQERGEAITSERLHTIDREIEHELDDWHQEIRAKEKRIHESRRQLYGLSFRDVECVERCGRIYRSLCLALHPDLGAERREDFEAWWHAIEKAYTRSDVEYLEIIAFALEVEVEDEASCQLDPEDISLGGLEELRRERNRLTQRLDEERERHESIRERPPFSYRDLLKDGRQLDTKQSDLKRRAASLRERRDRLRAILDRQSPVDAPTPPVRPSTSR